MSEIGDVVSSLDRPVVAGSIGITSYLAHGLFSCLTHQRKAMIWTVEIGDALDICSLFNGNACYGAV